jgi:hypothetical protein
LICKPGFSTTTCAGDSRLLEAKTLGLEIPAMLLALADELIE